MNRLCTDDGKVKSSRQSTGCSELSFTTAGTPTYLCTPRCSTANRVGTVVVQ